jgi:signal transduction histidine kinase
LILARSDPAYIKGAANLLERVLLNIFQNSIDHTNAGGLVTAKVVIEGPEIVLSVRDNGSGISERDLPHIFTRFYKGESEKGNGLGLSIVKEIVMQHKGKIEVASAEGVGTTITVQFPAR